MMAVELQIPKKWGIFVQGSEKEFVRSILATQRNGEVWRYCELGIGDGDTLKAVADVASQLTESWEIYGVDLPSYGGAALKLEKFQPQNAVLSHYRSYSGKGIHLCLFSNEVFLTDQEMEFDLVFIDACHGKKCVMRDFQMVEPLVRSGGIVCFHDTDEIIQGIYPQHCSKGIEVRTALKELGLLNGNRPGWRLWSQTLGNRAYVSHGCMWFIKGSEPS